MTTSATTSRLLLSSPVDILVAVPYLVGFHPARSLVVIGLTGEAPHGQLCLTTRWDLPLPEDGLDPLLPLLRREGVTQVIVVGYGPGALATPAVDAVRDLAREAGLHVRDALRTEARRFWSYLCETAECCPAEGTPFDPTVSSVAVHATVNGLVALPDRAALEESVTGLLDPVARTAMHEATATVAADVRARLAMHPSPDGFAAEFVAEGIARVHSSLAAAAEGVCLDDLEAARLGLDLAVVRIRDEAWTLICEEEEQAHLLLWKDLTRRLEPRFVPPAASLLAMTSWRRGDCATAGIALERALEIDPTYSMANLLMHALCQLMSPKILQDRMPNSEELDREMGSPRLAWLTTMIGLTDPRECLPVSVGET
ncbi:DUF4192 domain-containing protein [Sinosporangium siamense]|nr:DUF4192 domain-containing protein [Sinosporangium siamense]